MRTRTYDEDRLTEAVAQSSSLRQVMQALGLAPAGGNYATLRRHIERLRLSTTHFRHPPPPPRVSAKPTAALLQDGTNVQSYKLKARLLKEGLLVARCHACGNTHWLGQPIPLELHHQDGNRRNNLLSNLTLLCPNCHALTDTYRGRNIGKA